MRHQVIYYQQLPGRFLPCASPKSFPICERELSSPRIMNRPKKNRQQNGERPDPQLKNNERKGKEKAPNVAAVPPDASPKPPKSPNSGLLAYQEENKFIDSCLKQRGLCRVLVPKDGSCLVRRPSSSLLIPLSHARHSRTTNPRAFFYYQYFQSRIIPQFIVSCGGGCGVVVPAAPHGRSPSMRRVPGQPRGVLRPLH